jgi:hypothetical protein
MFHPRILLGALSVRELRLRRRSTILVFHGVGEGSHFCMVEASQVWRQMPQVILQYPYASVDFWGDPNMVLSPGEVFDQRGMFMILIC